MTKLCECGCGEAAPIAKMTNAKWGHVKNEPVRFIRGHHNFRLRRDPADRFWEKVAKAGPDECWEWQGAKQKGYGTLLVGEGASRRLRRAHRFSYELAVGPIPKGLQVLHRCDNPPCCNPAHLRVGDQSQNMREMWDRKRRRQKTESMA